MSDNGGTRNPLFSGAIAANALATEAAKPMLMETGFQEILHTFHLPPAFPGEDFDFDQEP